MTSEKTNQKRHTVKQGCPKRTAAEDPSFVDQMDDLLRQYLEDAFSSLPEEFQPEVQRKPLTRKSQVE